jgi:hypothetical protein
MDPSPVRKGFRMRYLGSLMLILIAAMGSAGCKEKCACLYASKPFQQGQTMCQVGSEMKCVEKDSRCMWERTGTSCKE